MIRITRQAIPDILLLEPDKFGDTRGAFSETFRASVLTGAGVSEPFVQDNHAWTASKGVLRGLHFQVPPHAQGKLLRVTRGAIYDVAVDIRKHSPSYGHHVAAELSAANWRQLYVPSGFAHGYLTLTDDTEVLYKTTAYYNKDAEGGLLWRDPELGIAWPLPIAEITCNARDAAWPLLKTLGAAL